MFKRIRYSKNGDSLVSIKSFQHDNNGSRYRVTLTSSSKSFSIVDETIDKEVLKGAVLKDSEDLHRLKIEAKKGLISLGIQFADDVREIEQAIAS